MPLEINYLYIIIVIVIILLVCANLRFTVLNIFI